jgi:hypothetical protein
VPMTARGLRATTNRPVMTIPPTTMGKSAINSKRKTAITEGFNHWRNLSVAEQKQITRSREPIDRLANVRIMSIESTRVWDLPSMT